jgi:hypothetical protein
MVAHRWIHPSLPDIAAFADNELSAHRRTVVSNHMTQCARCRRSLALVRDLAREAGREAPPAPPHIVEKALAARAQGRRMLLPTGDASATPVAAAPVRRRLIAVAAALGGIAVYSLFGSTSRVDAGLLDSEMTITPSAPRPGDRIMVTYRSSVAALSGRKDVVLRGRLRSVNSDAYDEGVSIVTLDTLSASRDVYEGSFTLPDSIVFAALAVEAVDGSVVDDRNGRAWAIEMHDGTGRPTLEALSAHIDDLLGRSWEDANAVGHRIVELYPDNIRSWSLRRFFETVLSNAGGTDSSVKHVRDRIAQLERQARDRRNIPPAELASFIWESSRDTAARRYWSTRAANEARGESSPASYRMLMYAWDHFADPKRVLRWTDTLWSELKSPDWQTVDRISQGMLEMADSARSVADYLTWSRRRVEAMPWTLTSRGIALSRRPALRDEGMQMLRRALSAADPDRPLEQNVREFAVTRAEARRRTLAALGRALVEGGNVRGGLDTLAIASREGWDPAVFRDVARARITAGDSTGAYEALSMVAVDPTTPSSTVDSINRVGRRLFGEGPWQGSLDAGHARMTRHFLSKAVDRQVRGQVRLTDRSGAEIRLDSLTGGRPAVVFFWSRFCPPAVDALAGIQQVMQKLGSEVPVILVADEPPSAEFDAFLVAKRVKAPVWHDTRREGRLGYGVFGTPAQYVLDARGRIRFDDVGGTENLPAQIAALRAEAAKAGK